MANFSINYGKNVIQYKKFHDDLYIDIVLPDYYQSVINPKGKIEFILNNSKKIHIQRKGCKSEKVAIAINDQTRPVPHEVLLTTLIKYLKKYGYQNQDIHFFIATGTHKFDNKYLLKKYLPGEIIDSCHFSIHDCDDNDNLSYLGTTKLGTPVYINSDFMKADLKIVVGNIEPHHYMGFSGGCKSAAIGLAGRETINENHKWLMDSRSFIANYEDNPCRQDVEEIGDMIGIHAALNVVLNQDKQIYDVFWDSPREVMRIGVPVSRRVCQKRVSKQYDVVIASPGGYPKDINLYQSQKAITHASLLAKEGGVIILMAQCSQGLGNIQFEKYLDGMATFRDIIKTFRRTKFTVGPHKAYQFAQQALRNKIILVSEMSNEIIKKTMLTPADSLDHALSIANDHVLEVPEIAILPFATNTIPLIE